jgi:hypothetical protein
MPVTISTMPAAAATMPATAATVTPTSTSTVEAHSAAAMESAATSTVAALGKNGLRRPGDQGDDKHCEQDYLKIGFAHGVYSLKRARAGLLLASLYAECKSSDLLCLPVNAEQQGANPSTRSGQALEHPLS